MLNDYFEWMYSTVFTDSDGNYIPNYHDLMQYLDSRSFNYTIPLDGNRESDGISLRYTYGWKMGIPNPVIATELDFYPCSVLEVMVALSCRMESDIMGDYIYGDRTNIWFFSMLQSLGLDDMTDENFDEEYTKIVIDNFLNRNYESNGKGGLFTVKDPHKDMRLVEIWDQAMWFLNEYVEENESE